MAPYRAKKVNDFPDSSPTTPPILIAGRKKRKGGYPWREEGNSGGCASVQRRQTTRFSTMTATISELELDYRIEQASFALFEGKKVSMKAGVFRASGTTPKYFMQTLLNYLRCQELEMIQSEYGVECDYIKPREWRVMITRKPSDYTFVIQATCIGWRLSIPLGNQGFI